MSVKQRGLSFLNRTLRVDMRTLKLQALPDIPQTLEQCSDSEYGQGLVRGGPGGGGTTFVFL